MVVRAIGGAHAIAFVGGEEVDVDAAAGEGGRGSEEVARPADAARVVGWVRPAAVEVHDELGVAVRVRRGARGRPGSGAAEGAEKDLALRGRQLPDVRDDDVEEPVLERREVVGLPIIAGAGGEQRVEGLLPGDVRLDADVFAQGGAERAQRRDERRPLLRVARIEQRERHDPLAVDLVWEGTAGAAPGAGRSTRPGRPAPSR